MSAKPVPKAFEGFKRLGTSTYLFEPSSAKKYGESAPDLILLCSWLDALPKHIAKYTEGYNALYPHTRILLVTTSFLEMSFNGTKAELARIEPVIEVLLSGPPDQKILLEFFSNGGAYTSCYIAREYKARTGRCLPIGAQIQDSSPGQWGYARSISALSMSLPKSFILRWLGYVFLHLFMSWYVVVVRITGQEYFNTVIGRQLNNKMWFDQAAPRLYFYSRTDSMVSWEHIEAHAKEAKVKGYQVTKEEFVGSAHCGHMMRDPARYWGAVKAVWERQ